MYAYGENQLLYLGVRNKENTKKLKAHTTSKVCIFHRNIHLEYFRVYSSALAVPLITSCLHLRWSCQSPHLLSQLPIKLLIALHKEKQKSQKR